MAEPVRFQHFEVPLREDGSLHELGRGAMGITYKAFDTNLRCFVALKVINTAFLGSDVARQRFLREARAAAALRHPNVAAVFHLGEEGPDCFYAMEYVDGETVEAMMKREGALAATTALEVVLQVSRALGAAHKHGLVHRDIKPSNLMIAREDGEFTVKVIDFGLAKNTGAGEGESEATLTMGGFLGTPHFASPEQLDERDLDVRSDIYSLGVTLYYMLAGRAPFSGSMAQVMSQHLHREPPLESLSDQPVQVVDLLRHMLAKDPAARPQTPGDLRREVEACLAAARSLPSAAPAEIAAPENFETQALDEPPGAAAVEVVPGAEFAGHYRIQNETRFSKLGKVFKAERVETSEPVSLVVLDSALVSSAEACTRIENQVVALQQIGESALQKILSLERFDHISFLTLEWVEGPNLLDLLRARKALPLAEALAILRPLAFGFDALCPAGLPCPDIAVHDVLVPGIDVWQPVPAEVAVKFNALSPGVGEASPGATLVTSSLAMMRESGSFSGSEERAFVFTLASLAYDLLGGIRSGSSSGAPVPVAGLTEMANTAVRRALSPASSSFSSCAVFLDALEGLRMPEEEEEIPEEDFAGQSALPVHVLAPPVIHQPAEPATRLLNRPVFWIAAGAVGVLFASGLALHYFRPPSASHGGIPSPSPSAEPATPTPTATPVPPPTPAPHQAALDLILRQPETDSATTLTALLALERKFPDKPDIHQEIVKWISGLSDRTRTMNPGGLASLRTPLETAASSGFPDAAILLGEMTRKTDPSGALKWFLKAADVGNTDAMVKAGEMIAKGAGDAAPDLAAGAKLFQRAADLQDPVAMYDLGECFLHGKGVAKDASRAVQLLSGAAAKHNARAMNLLGDLYKNGLPGTITPNPAEAFRLFSSAKDLGDLDAQGNLGVLYINGLGVNEDDKKAVELFKDGSDKGNALCMFFYAMALESGVGGTPVNIEKAKELYLSAAQGGNPPALDWCKKNNVPVRAPAGASR